MERVSYCGAEIVHLHFSKLIDPKKLSQFHKVSLCFIILLNLDCILMVIFVADTHKPTPLP